MILTVLGCSGSVSGPTSAASGYLMASEGDRIVLDLGNGTLAKLHEHVDPFMIDAILFSHLHADHCADFPLLTVMRRYHTNPPYDPRSRRLPVYGPTSAPGRLAAAYAVSELELRETDLSDVFAFSAYPATPTGIAGFTVTAARVAHPCEAYGLRIERGGRSLCYTGDTGPCENVLRLADGVDTLLAEASWTDAADRPVDLHLSGRQAGELAAKAGVGRLVLTHVQPWTDRDAVLAEARAAFPGDVTLAEPGSHCQV